MLVLSLIGLVFGVLMLINPFKVAATVMILIGAGLVYSGVTDLVAILFISQQIRRDMNAPGSPFAR